MAGKLSGSAIQSNTITITQIQTTAITNIVAQAGPRVTSLIYPGDDTAGNTVGGQTVYINGSGFETNNAIYINGNAVPSKSFISASNLSFTTPALSAGIYPVYVINTDSGATAIFVPGYIASAEPAWVTSAGSLNASQDEATAWSYSLSATGDAPITYALASGSTLPSGISLAANGVVSGTLSSPPGTETTYTFSVVATDAENQESTRQFTVTTSSGEGVLFANNVLLIHADGTNNKNNHTFLDSSNNNLTITRYGNATQGSFSPFSQTGWSNFFDGTGDYLTVPDNLNLRMGSGNFTIEFWWYPVNLAGFQSAFDKGYTAADGLLFQTGNGDGRTVIYAGGSSILTSNTAVTTNTWTHVALVRNASTMTLYQNGISVGSGSNSTNFSNTSIMGVGANATGGGGNVYAINGYLSNFRVVKDTAVYTANFTPSTTPLTAVSNTSLLTCQSNRFRDASNNNFAITRNGDTSIQAFAPFAPTAAYSTANVGGSGYFDGTDDYLTWSGTTLSGNFTAECWVYKTAVDASGYTNIFSGSDGNHQLAIDLTTAGSISLIIGASTIIGGSGTAVTPYAWHHLAWVREGSTCRVYVNGVQQGSGTSSASFAIGTIGRFYQGGYEMNGYISGARIIAGTCLYPSGTTFTPPIAPPTNVANTAFLCNFTNAGIFDQTAKTILETVGDAKVSTTQYKYGTGSMYFDGTGDYLQVRNASPLFNFGTGNFTVEFWMYPVASTGDNGMYDSRVVDLNATGFTISLTDAEKIQFYSDTQKILGTTTVSLNTWTHIAVTRSGTSLRLFVNGVLDGNVSNSQNFTDTNITIGRGVWASSEFEGYLDDFRVTKGYARYTSNFTPPTSAFKDK